MGLYLRGKVWWVQFKYAGQRYQQSTGETARSAAEAAARRIRVNFENEVAELGPSRGKDGVTIGMLEELHLERYRRKGATERQIKTKKLHWRNLNKHLGENCLVSELTLSNLEEYEGLRRAEKRRGENVRGQTIRRERQTLIAALKLAKRDKLIARMPFDTDDLDPIKSDPPQEQQDGKLWPTETIDAVIAHLSPKALHGGLQFGARFLQGTGLRFEEFKKFSMTWIEEFIAPQGDLVAVLHIPALAAKTKDPRDLPLTQQLLDIAKKWGSRFSVMDLSAALKRAANKVGLAPLSVTPRDLRVWYLSHVEDPIAAQRLGGHRNIATTGLYLKADRMRALLAGVAVAKQLEGTTERDYSMNKGA